MILDDFGIVFENLYDNIGCFWNCFWKLKESAHWVFDLLPIRSLGLNKLSKREKIPTSDILTSCCLKGRHHKEKHVFLWAFSKFFE